MLAIMLSAALLPTRAQEAAARQTVLRAIAVNGHNLQGSEWDTLTIAPNDTLSLAYACRCPPSPSPLLFRLTLRRLDDNREQVRSIGVDSVLYTNLPEGSYSFTVQAFAPTEGWFAEPVTLTFRVDPAVTGRWKEFRHHTRSPDTLSAPSRNGSHHAEIWVWGLLGLALAATVGATLVIWYRVRTRHRVRTMTHRSRTASPDLSPSYDALLAENSRLKAELSNLRGQISALEARSRHLQQENQLLREQVDRLSAKQEELERLQEQKDTLFAMLVHDIKNPALIIRSLVELLKSYDLSAQEQQDIINDILETSTRIVELSQEISRILTLEAKLLELDIQPVDIAEVVRSVCHQNAPLAERKSITLRHELQPELPPVPADPQRLEEVLDNLLSNAIKYSHSGATVVVRAYTRDRRMCLEVEDNGLGMSEEDIRNAFQRGSRLSTKPTAGEPSSGLGLWIVKRLVEAHNGSVRIRSALGKGTTVYVELPLEQPLASSPATPEA